MTEGINLSIQEQANAVYYLRKVRQQEFARLVAIPDTKLNILQDKWKHLEELFIEEARLYALSKEG